jgi:hypothetical protein
MMIVGVILGAMIMLLLELNKGLAKNDFSWSWFFKINLIPFVVNILIGIVCIWAKDDLKDIYPITAFSSVMLGMSGQATFKKITAIFDQNTETKLGINGNK